jgi:hypothetical protein
MILDELDSGVGSRLGGPVGQLLRRMSARGSASAASQIICVSHLPQVHSASCMGPHLYGDCSLHASPYNNVLLDPALRCEPLYGTADLSSVLSLQR